MKTSAKALCIGCTTAVLLGSTAVQAQEACSTYVVEQGDHLRKIARKAYGNPDLYRVIFDANRDIIGSKADLILVGASLSIPCDPAKPDMAAADGADAAGSANVEDPVSVPLSTDVIDPASTPLATGVVDPAKEPLVILPELPVVDAGAETAVAEAEPAPEATTTEVVAAEPAVVEEVAPVEESATEEQVAEVVVEEAEPVPTEPVSETAEIAPAEEAAVEEAPAEVAEPAPVEEAPAEEVAVAVEPEAEPAVDAAVTEEPVVEVAAVAEAAAESAPTAAEGADGSPIKIVTGNGYAPFADETLPGGGMFTQIVEMAVFRADPDQPYTLTFINDWQAHVDALLPSQAYDLSFPWIRPNCEAPETLSAGDIARCNDFAFSAPYYEVVDGFFAAADSDLLLSTDYTDFAGKRICRPEGYTTGVLESQGLGADKVTLIRPIEASDCFEALADGKVDLVSIDTAVGDATLKQLDMVEKARQNPNLSTVLTLHVIAHKSNARAVDMLKMLDEGALEMNQSGEWWDIVSSALETQ